MRQDGMSKMAHLIGGALVNQVKAADSFFSVQKAGFIQQAAQQGMDPNQAQAFLDNIGLAEINLQSLFNLANMPGYVNSLRLWIEK